MLKFILKRLAYGVLTLFLITTATFFLVAGAPGDPIVAKVGQMPEKAQAIIRHKYGLDKPVGQRYLIYMKQLITEHDFGESIIYSGKTANDVIKKNTPVSARIGIISLLLQTVIGLLLGIVAALNHGKTADNVIRVLVVLAICIPSFVFAALLQYFIAFKWRWVPVFGWGKPVNYVLPVLSYVIGGVAGLAKYMRSSVLQVLNEDYIVTAKAKGCTRKRIIRKHVLRNAGIPMVTILVPAIGGIFGGSFIIEKMFSIPGVGQYYVKAVSDSDYTMVIGLTIFFAMLYVISLIAVDIVYGLVDPRIRVTGGER